MKKDIHKSEPHKKEMKRHLLALFILFIFILIFLTGKVISINVNEKQKFQTSVLSQHVTNQTSTDVIAAKRGSIVDRNGTVLAESLKVYNVIYDPGVLKQYDQTIIDETNLFMSGALEGVSVAELKVLLLENANSHYEVIARGLDYESVKSIEEAIDSKKVEGIFLEGYYVRRYPYNSTAADVLGFYSNTTGGTYGIEEYYEEYLKGTQGRLFGSLDDGIIVNQEEVAPIHGSDVVLTIDYTIQRYVEQSIAEYYEVHDAKSVNVIVMNPKNGEVLAMASSPSVNLNNSFSLEGIIDDTVLKNMTEEEKYQVRFELWKNYNVSATIEPGSTYKAFTLAAALEEGRVSIDQTFECDGGKQVANYYIRCWKDGGHGVQTTIEALANSCNVAFMEIGESLGVDYYYNYQRMFGFGAKTNADVLGEEVGILYNHDQFGRTELATGAFGQGFNITPIQLITAFSSLLNGGYLYEPSIMKKIVDDEGRIVSEKELRMIRQVISEDTSSLITSVLEKTVSEGTGHRAQIEGYLIGGKTGTAEKGDRSEDRYVISFIGFAPVEDPQLITLVVIDEPVSEKAESSWAVDVFYRIMEKVLPYKTIFPSAEEITRVEEQLVEVEIGE